MRSIGLRALSETKRKLLISAALLILSLLFMYSLRDPGFFASFRWGATIFLIAFLLRPVLSLRTLCLFDGGFALSFGLGLAVSFLLSWFASAIGLMRFDTLPCIAALIILTILVNALSFRKKLSFHWTKEEFSRFILGAALFFVLFATAFYVKGFQASIGNQTEQFMDYGFMQSMYRQKEARPYDFWFSGQKLNYYYLGQAAAVYLCRLSFDTPEYGYNLMLVTIFAALFMMVFSLIESILSALGRFSRRAYGIRAGHRFLGAFLGALVTVCGANGHYVVYGLFLPFLEKVTKKDLVKDFWFPDSTVFIGGFEGSIDHGKHEYPAYSVVLGDLHAHVVNMLFTIPLLVLLFDYAAYWTENAGETLKQRTGEEERDGNPGNPDASESAAIRAEAVSPGGAAIRAEAVLSDRAPEREEEAEGVRSGFFGTSQEEDEFSRIMRSVNKTSFLKLRMQNEEKKVRSELPGSSGGEGVLRFGGLSAASQLNKLTPFGKDAFVSDRPMLFHFILIGVLLGLYCGVNYWDFPIYFVVSGAVILFCDLWRFGAQPKTFLYVLAKGGVILVISKLSVLPFTLSFDKISSEFGICDHHSRLSELLLVWGFKFYVSIALMVFLAWRFRKTGELCTIERALLAFSLCAIGLILSPEVVYVKDIYGEDYQRYNTMFKLTYQGFLFFGILTGIVIAIFLSSRRIYRLQAGLIILASLLTSTYLSEAAVMWFGNFLLADQRKGISATDFMRRGENEYGLEWGAIEYLNGLPEEQLHIIEAAGTSYQPDDKLSVFTGASTVIGWYVHEWLWRSNSEVVRYRSDEVRSFYESGDKQYCEDFIERFDIDYIYLGPREYYYYAIRTEGFNENCEVAWDDQGYALLKVKRNADDGNENGRKAGGKDR